MEAPPIAVIDIRTVTLWIVDGSTSTLAGAVNHSGGYPAVPFTPSGTSTIAVNTFVGAVTVGQYVTFASHMQFYEVLAHTESTGNTTALTLFPALQMAVTNSEVITVIGNAVYVKVGEGNLTYSEKRNLVYVRDRGFLDTIRLGDDEPLDVSIDFTWEFLKSTSGNPPTVEEAMKHIGNASSWVSTSIDPCEPYAVDIIMLDIPPCGTDAESLVLPEFRWTSLDHDMRGGKVSVKGTCNRLFAEITHAAP